MLPISFAARNLSRSWARTLQIAAGTGLASLLLMAAAAFDSGMRRALSEHANPNNALLIGKGSEESMQRSEIPAGAASIVAASIAGLKTTLGQAHVSPEILYNGYIETPSHTQIEATIRGVSPAAQRVHDSFELIAGHWPGPGEVLVGRHAASQAGLPPSSLQTGNSLIMDNETFIISGIFAMPGSIHEGEIWMELHELMTLTKRDSLSSLTVTLEDAAFGDIEAFAASRLDLELSALRETDYYARMSTFYAPIRAMVWLCAVLVATGAVFGGFNTLFTAFAGRRRELAVLQAMGFPRWQITLSLMQESLMSCLIGSIGALFIATCLLDGRQTFFAGGVFTLHVSTQVLILGLSTGLTLATFGLAAPCWVLLRPPLVQSLR